MKRLALFSTLLLFLLVVSACQQDLEQPADKAVKGQWQWMNSAGGIVGESLAPINSTMITLSLNSDSTYVFYLNNMPQDSGSYSIQAAADEQVLRLDHAIEINRLSMEPEQLVLQWDNSQLRLLDKDISDGFNHYFKKVQ